MSNKNMNNSSHDKDLHISNAIMQTGSNDNLNAKPCNCEKSQCLKLYCECFARNELCTKYCNCRDCKNNGLYMVILLGASL